MATAKNVLKVLLVDDDPDLGTFMKMKLSQEARHFSIAFVESGEECLEYLKANEADCILSDFQMPGMNGMELLLALRGAGREVPVIFVTGQGNEEVAREAFKNGAYDYFTKDIGFAHFSRIINSVEQAVKQRAVEAGRKRAEEAHRRSDENIRHSLSLLRAALDSTADGILIVDTSGQVTNFNNKFLRMWKIPKPLSESRDDRVLLEYVREQLKEPQQFLVRVQDIYADREAEVLDVLEFKDGRVFERYSQPQKIGDETVGRVWSFRDITKRKHAEEALGESLSAYQALAENLPGIVYRVFLREKCRMRFLNKAAENITGYTDKELHGGDICPLETLVLPEDRDAVISEVKRAVSENRPFMVEYRLKHKDGGIRYMLEQGAPIYGPDEKPLYIEGVVFDVTGHKRVEDELKKFKFIVDGAGEEFYLLDPSGNIVYANETAARSFGYTMDEMLGLNVSGFNPAYAPIFKKYFEELKGHDMPPFETVHITKDGRAVPKEVKAAYIELGGKDYVCSFTRDITERKNLERQRADFYAMVTHDLKSPLATILGYSELISNSAQRMTGGDVIEEMAKAMSRSGDKMLKVVDDFMVASRLESGGVEVWPVAVEATGLLLEVRDDFEPIARKKGVAFTADIPDGLPLAVMDKKQVERAVGNLMQNAFNYTPKGGEVRLAAESVPYGDGKCILVSVSDTGPGIPKEDMDRIFDKYYRSPKTSGTKGTGLGLAIVKAVADAHGGMVEVQSEEGKGSTFRLYLPVGK